MPSRGFTCCHGGFCPQFDTLCKLSRVTEDDAAYANAAVAATATAAAALHYLINGRCKALQSALQAQAAAGLRAPLTNC